MIENPDLVRGYGERFMADARIVPETDLDGRRFAVRGVMISAFALSGCDYDVFKEQLRSLIGGDDDRTKSEVPDINTVRNIKRIIFSRIMPRNRSCGMPETSADLLDGLMNDRYYFTDMPEQLYPTASDTAA